MLENVVIELAKRIDVVKTLSTNKPNWITKVDDQGVYIETDASREKFNNGKKSEAAELLTFKYISSAWEELIDNRVASADDFTRTRGRSSFLMALLNQLPFVEVQHSNPLKIALKEFKTDDLPRESYQRLETVIAEVKKSFYVHQDLRLIGFINEGNEKNEQIFSEYDQATDQNGYIRKLILKNEFFKINLIVLDLLKEYPPDKKKAALIGLAMILVRNSKGDNLIVEGVAKSRVSNLLNWLKTVDIIDDMLVPIIDISHLKESSTVKTNIRELLLQIMNKYIQAKTESFASHPIGMLMRRELPSEFNKLNFVNESYTVSGSVGQGNWAAVPWLAIMDRKVTTSTQRGYYIVYLFSEDMQRLYLTIAQGVTETSHDDMVQIKNELQSMPMAEKVKKDEKINLGESTKAKKYEFSTAVYIEYFVDQLVSETELVDDLRNMVGYYQQYIELKNISKANDYSSNPLANEIHDQKGDEILSSLEIINHIHSYITNKGFYYEREEVMTFYLSLRTKPFVILSGISGTGKTKIVELVAKSVGANKDNGRYLLIPVRPDWSDGSDLIGYTDIKGEFKEGPLYKVIEAASNNRDKPYFVLLDEMNLARVEHYFSDLLSIMESREWQGKEIITLPLPANKDESKPALYLPENLYIIGTVNMDETTHPFSKKVLDRGNTIEFNRIKLDHLAFLNEEVEIEPINVSNHMFVSRYLQLKDVYRAYPDLVTKLTNELVTINDVLEPMSAHFGYRVRDEIAYYLAYSEEGQLMELNQALDHCILQKILPRLSGSDTRVERVLGDLYKIFTNKNFDTVENVNLEDLPFSKYPKSAEKVLEMLRRLEDDGFTSFWLGS